jgi:predicted AAA+ superfamily ATPase
MQTREIFYWRDKRGHEVDFILRGRRNKPIPVECKWSASDFDVTNLRIFRRQYAERESYVLAQDIDRPFSHRFGEITVRFENLETFAKAIGLGRMDA